MSDLFADQEEVEVLARNWRQHGTGNVPCEEGCGGYVQRIICGGCGKHFLGHDFAYHYRSYDDPDGYKHAVNSKYEPIVCPSCNPDTESQGFWRSVAWQPEKLPDDPPYDPRGDMFEIRKRRGDFER